MFGLLVDQQVAWEKIQFRQQLKLLDQDEEELHTEFQQQMELLHLQTRRDLTSPAEPHEGY
jgi:hypothetical protein